MKDNTVPEEIQIMAKVLLREMETRFNAIEDDELVTISTLLDPRFKTLGFSDKASAEKACNFLKQKVSLASTTSPQVTGELTDDNSALSKSFSSILWGEFDEEVNKLRGTTNLTAVSVLEVDKYLQEPIINRLCNPLVWWNDRKFVYPLLYQIMKKHLCIVPTSVPCERIFSKAGQIITERRSRLLSSKIKQIVFLGHNLK